jgi:cell division protein FtsB
MRALSLAVFAFLVGIQVPLWFGKGGWLRVGELRRQLDDQRAINEATLARNGALTAELASLSAGREAIEERARHELHMVRGDEWFFQWVEPAARVGATPVTQQVPAPLRP